MFFTTTVLNRVSTIAAESPDTASESATDDLFNDQEYVEVYYPPPKKNEISSVKDPIKQCDDGNDTQITTT